MIHWMGRYPRVFPFPLTIITMIVTWAIAVLIHQLDPDLGVVTAVIFIVLAVFVYFMVIKFVLHILNPKIPIPGRVKVFGFLDGYFSFLHIFSGIAMAIIVLSNPINQHFANIPVGTKGYDLYWTFSFSNIVLIFNTAGFGNSGGKTALGVFPVLLTSITGTIYMVVVLALLITHISSSMSSNSNTRMQNSTKQASYRQSRTQRGNRPSRRGNALIIKQ